MSPLLLLSLLTWLTALVSARTAPLYELEKAEQHFEQFIQKYEKQYIDSNEKEVRLQVFKENLERVNRMNGMTNKTVFGITQFMDLTPDEFVKTYANLKMPSAEEIASYKCGSVSDDDVKVQDLPSDFAWNQVYSGVTISNQEKCNAGYAFSASGNIQFLYTLKNADSLLVSPQQIIDCDTGSHGCSGGNTLSAFSSIVDLGGIESEADYPFVKHDKNKCKFNQSNLAVKVVDCISYNLTTHDKVQQVLYLNGPLSVAVKATAFQFYADGIMDDAFCNHGEINHSVLVFGYFTYSNFAYWVAVNSWGASWGHGGIFFMELGPTATACGMLNPLMSTAVIG